MNIENYIESQYRELLSCSQINVEYSDLYKSFRNQILYLNFNYPHKYYTFKHFEV